MALACLHTDHPVGDGTFCRICGRHYVDAPQPVEDVHATPAPVEGLSAAEHELPLHAALQAGGSAVMEAPTSPVLPEPAHTWSAPPATSVPPGVVLVPEAWLADASEQAVDDGEQTAEPDPTPTAGRRSQSQLLAVAGFGGGALVMALLDRLVL